MKSQRGVRLPTAPPTRKHGTRKYDRKDDNPQNWKDYLDMERWEAQEDLEEIMAEHRAERELVDDDYPTTEERETEEEVSEGE